MYKEFYGFREIPFSEAIDYDTNRVYLSQNYAMPLAILVSSLDKGVTLTLLVGADGVGKTTLISYLHKQIQQDFAVGRVDVHLQSVEGLLQQTLASFGQESNKGGVDELLRQLRDVLSAEFEKQHNEPSVLIIDNADTMPPSVLKGIELLLDLNSENSQLLQLVLVGRYEVQDLLNAQELQGVSKRVGTLCCLDPLTVEETQSYIAHRLKVAGAVDEKLFDAQAGAAVYECSQGIPRKINSICDEALLRSSAQRKHEVNQALIREVANVSGQAQTFELAAADPGSRIPRISGSRKVRRFFNRASLAGGIFAGIILALVFALDRFSLFGEEPQLSASNEPALGPVEEKPIGQIRDPMHISRNSFAEGQDEDLPGIIPTNVTMESLFVIAESHIQALRLTTPKGQNALDIYRGILDRTPDHELARQGVERVAGKFRELAEREERLGNHGKAKSYLVQAAAILPESEDIRKALIQAETRLDQTGRTNVASQVIRPAPEKARASAEDKKVAKLLAEAERQFVGSKLIMPEKDNAYETYTALLPIAPNDARAGLQRIANRYLELAKIQRAEGNLDQSRTLVARGLKVSPDHRQLTALKKQFDIKMKRRSQQDKIEALTKQASRQVAALQLTEPLGDNAYKTYQDILAIEKNNRQAVQGIEAIQQRLESQIQDALDRKDFGAAREVAEEVLAIPSYGPGDRFLETTNFAAVETTKIIANQLENLLSRADQARKAGRLVHPAGDNALESYRKILEIDPTNAVAEKGLDRLVEDYQVLIRDAISGGKTRQALAIANESLRSFPDNPDLRALRDNAVLQRKAAPKTAAKPPIQKTPKNSERGLQPFGNF